MNWLFCTVEEPSSYIIAVFTSIQKKVVLLTFKKCNPNNFQTKEKKGYIISIFFTIY